MTLNEYQIQKQFGLDDVFILAADAEGHRCVLLKSKGENIVQRLKTDCMILKTNVEMLDKIGSLEGLGDSEQMTLFEFGLDL